MVSAAVLAGMIADLLRDRLALILAQLRAEAYALGHQSGSQAAGQPSQQAMQQASMAQLAIQAAIRQMSATGMAGLAAALLKALLAGGVTLGILLALLDTYLNADRRAWLIAISEVERAIGEGSLDAYIQAGVAFVRWQTRNDSKVCGTCKANQAAGPLATGSLFPGGVVAPLQHPQCRCSLLPALPPSVPNGQPDVTKADKPWKHIDTSKSPGAQVYAQLLDDFPPEAIAWVKRAKWTGPEDVPLDAIVFTPSKWQAGHEPAKVERFKRKIAARQAKGKPVKPVVLADRPDTAKGTHLYMVDGHHRALAFRELGRPVLAYVGQVARRGREGGARDS